MYFTIYRIINNINGKQYLGKHQTKNLNDEYMGSGIAVIKAIKKYGKENFTKEILHIFETEEEMNAKEMEIVTREFISDENNYNKGIGGEGGSHFKGKFHSEETKQKIREKRKFHIFTEETRLKISKKAKQEKNINHLKKLSDSQKGIPRSEETKQKIRNTFRLKQTGQNR